MYTCILHIHEVWYGMKQCVTAGLLVDGLLGVQYKFWYDNDELCYITKFIIS